MLIKDTCTKITCLSYKISHVLGVLQAAGTYLLDRLDAGYNLFYKISQVLGILRAAGTHLLDWLNAGYNLSSKMSHFLGALRAAGTHQLDLPDAGYNQSYTSSQFYGDESRLNPPSRCCTQVITSSVFFKIKFI